MCPGVTVTCIHPSHCGTRESGWKDLPKQTSLNPACNAAGGLKHAPPIPERVSIFMGRICLNSYHQATSIQCAFSREQLAARLARKCGSFVPGEVVSQVQRLAEACAAFAARQPCGVVATVVVERLCFREALRANYADQFAAGLKSNKTDNNRQCKSGNSFILQMGSYKKNTLLNNEE